MTVLLPRTVRRILVVMALILVAPRAPGEMASTLPGDVVVLDIDAPPELERFAERLESWEPRRLSRRYARYPLFALLLAAQLSGLKRFDKRVESP